VPRENDRSRGADLTARLQRARRDAEHAPRQGARDLPVVEGFGGQYQTVVPLENVLAMIHDIIVDSHRVYRYGNSVVFELDDGEERRLTILSTGQVVEGGADTWLGNLFVCRTSPEGRGESPREFAPPRKLAEQVLRREPTLQALPRILQYSRKPIFDGEFNLRGPGWHPIPQQSDRHPQAGLLVHGDQIEPVVPDGDVDCSADILDRLPSHIRGLLQDFCLKSDADVANVIAVLLTGLMVGHFVTSGKPIVLLDGNQPGVGKTLLARTIGLVIDGVDPRLNRYTPDDEELQKQILATLRGSQQSVLVLDNAKVKSGMAISSPTLESTSMAPEISLRILGKSENYCRPNDVIWFVTMNDTKASPDLVSRGLPIRFEFEGNPRDRDFCARDPIQYAWDHRGEILSELTGMIIRWNQVGRPPGQHHHRLAQWASVIGGIMCANRLPEGLTNLDDAATDFDTDLDCLTALAEAALAAPNGPVVCQGSASGG